MPPRPLRPKHEPIQPESSDTSDVKGGKRKAVSSACIPCRKRKSKCDGQLPSCSTCIAVYRTECSYDADSDFRRKGALKREVQSLQQQNDALDVIVAHLRMLPEPEAIALLQALRNDIDLDMVAESLRSNVGLPNNFASQTLEADFAQQMATPASSRQDSAMIRSPLSSDVSRAESYRTDFEAASMSDLPTAWFRIPQDAEHVEHLLNLYMCWVQPFHALISWEHFSHDMRCGRTDFCSAALVNAILSYACHYSDRTAALMDSTDATTAGDHFYAEAKLLLAQDSAPCLTTVQALGIMSLRETSAGRDSNGYQLAGRCVRMALEMGLHLSVTRQGLRPFEVEVRKATFWAVFNLETSCAVNFGRLSQLPRSAADIEITATNPRAEVQTWRPYEDTNLSISPSAEQPAHSAMFAEQLSKLSEIASDMVNTFYAPQERYTSRRLAATYRRYREWYQNRPEVLRLENTSLPHVLVLHMYYHDCVLHLFRPYIKYDLRAADLYPRDTCTLSANEISGLMNALRGIYGLRRVSVQVISLLLSASTIHLLNLPSESASTHLSQGLQDLEAMSTNHRFAARAVDVVRSLSRKWKIPLPKEAASVAVHRSTEPQETSPTAMSTFFAASIPRTHSSESQEEYEEGTGRSPFEPPSQSASRAVISQSQQPLQQSLVMPQQSTSSPVFYGQQTTPVDLQNLNIFWTPFPAQTMPAQTYDTTTTSLGFTSVDTGEVPWQQRTPDLSEYHEYHGRQASAPGRLHDGSGNMTDWHWQ